MIVYKKQVRMVRKKPNREKKILTKWYDEEYKCYLKNEYNGEFDRLEERYERVK